MANTSKRKRLLLVFLGAVIAIGVGVWLVWNKPRPKAEDQAGISVSAQELYTIFRTGAPSITQYEGKVVSVQGTVIEKGENGDGKPTASLETKDPDGGVIQCSFRDAANINTGQQVVVKGFCNGYTDLAPLGGTVVLNDCVIAQ
jgi:hypothetical protein